MVTLIRHGNSEGERRCDARCYNAKSDTCDCICGGKNHGRGLATATKNVNEFAKDMIDNIIDHSTGEKKQQHINLRMSLFCEDERR